MRDVIPVSRNASHGIYYETLGDDRRRADESEPAIRGACLTGVIACDEFAEFQAETRRDAAG